MANIWANGHKLIDDSDWTNTNVGQNLIAGSHSFDNFVNSEQLQTTKDVYGNFQALSTKSWVSPTKLFNVLAGQTICYSAIIQAKDSSNLPTISINAGDNKYGGTANVENGQPVNNRIYIDNQGFPNGTKLKDTNQHVVYAFFKVVSSGLLSCRIEAPESCPWLISSIKAEIGNIKTNWSPAPSDLVFKSELANLQNQINQLKNKN